MAVTSNIRKSRTDYNIYFITIIFLVYSSELGLPVNSCQLSERVRLVDTISITANEDAAERTGYTGHRISKKR